MNSHTLVLVLGIQHEVYAEERWQSEWDSNKTIILAAIGPEFQLGSLYDRRTDRLLSGFTLCKEDSFKKEGFIRERERDVSSKKWLTDSKNTFSSKVSNLGIEGGLELSLLGGLIDTTGHADIWKTQRRCVMWQKSVLLTRKKLFIANFLQMLFIALTIETY